MNHRRAVDHDHAQAQLAKRRRGQVRLLAKDVHAALIVRMSATLICMLLGGAGQMT